MSDGVSKQYDMDRMVTRYWVRIDGERIGPFASKEIANREYAKQKAQKENQ